MNKKELVKKVAELSSLPETKIEKSINELFHVILSELQNGQKVMLPGFGSFEIIEKAERKGLNPSTKQEIIIPAKKAVKFKAAKALKDAIQ